MSDETALLKAICDDPDDDGVRLVYADWLVERGAPGDDDRAEFIRVQCALANPGTPASTRKSLLEREEHLLEQHREAWEKPLRELGAEEITFQRGFPQGVTIESASFLRNAEALFARAPIRALHARLLVPKDLAALAASPHLRNLTTLDLCYNKLGPEGARALAASPHLRNLTTLDLWHNDLGAEGAQALAASPHLQHLTTLNLGLNDLGPEGARALAASPHLRNLTTLDLCYYNNIGPDGAQALARSPNLPNLTTLEFDRDTIGDAVLGEIKRTLDAKCLARHPQVPH